MKITAKKYAEALLVSLDGKDKNDAKKIIANLVNIMGRDRHFTDLDLMLYNFIELWDQKNNLTKVEVITANKMTADVKKIITEYIKKQTNKVKVEIKNKIDKDILGGIIIKEGDRVIDGSLRRRLYDLKEQIS